MDWQRQSRSTRSTRHWRVAKHPCSTSIHVIKSKELDVLTIISRAAIPHHAVEVLEYAAKHGYVDLIQQAGPEALSAHPLRLLVCAQKEGLDELMDRAAEATLASSLQNASRSLSAEMFIIWV